MQPVIGISSRLARDTAWAPPLIGVRSSYLDAILAAGGVPMPVPFIEDPTALRRLYEQADGILLPGGEDIDPRFYQEEPHARLGEICPERDGLELQLARWAAEDGKPLLAICRGIQVLNVALGGSLYQDLQALRGDKLGHARSGHVEDWHKLIHSMGLAPDSQLARLLGTHELMVNSLHHQAIKELAPGLRSAGTAPDGVIEAVEADSSQFMLGIQCHPEMLWQEIDTRWRRVFRGFIEAAAAGAGRR